MKALIFYILLSTFFILNIIAWFIAIFFINSILPVLIFIVFLFLTPLVIQQTYYTFEDTRKPVRNTQQQFRELPRLESQMEMKEIPPAYHP
jgi:Zn-dependent protease with chaperone function